MTISHYRVAAAAAAGIALGAAAGRLLGGSYALLRLRLSVAHASSRVVALCNVRVPCALLPASSFEADEEGLVRCDVVYGRSGRIEAVNMAGSTRRSLTTG